MIRILIFISLMFLLGGCGTTRRLTETTHQQDSVRVEVQTRTEYVRDTIYLEIPTQTAERTTADSTSHLENDYAVSDARILTDGSLSHTLATKPQTKPMPVNTKVITQDSIVYRDRWLTRTKTVKIEKQLTWFQKLQLWGCKGLLFFVVMSYTIKIIRTHIRQISNK